MSFSEHLWLCINLNKSGHMEVNVEDRIITRIVELIGYRLLSWSVTYLVIPFEGEALSQDITGSCSEWSFLAAWVLEGRVVFC